MTARFLRVAVSVVATLGLTLGVLAPGTSQARQVQQPALRIVNWNICGEAGGAAGTSAYCEHRNEPEKKVEQIERLVNDHQANVVTLQEVCGDHPESHLARLQARLGGGWSIKRADQVRESDGASDCRDPLKGTLGVAIAVKGTVTSVTADNVLEPSTVDAQQLPLLCVRVAGWTSRICTTHVIAASARDLDKRRREQIENIRQRVSADRPNVVLAGDFNLFPTSAALKPIQDGFEECDERARSGGDPVNETTHLTRQGVPSKRDHIFAGSRRFTFCDADQSRMSTPQKEAWSDHAPLIGYLRTAPAPSAGGDLNGDDKPDPLAVDGDGKLRLYGGNGAGGFSGSPDIIGSNGWSGASVTHRGDYTGEGYEDVVARIGGELWIYPTNGFGSLGARIKVADVPADAKIVSVGDLTGDGRPDLVAGYDDKLFLYAGETRRLKAPVLIGSGGWDRMTLLAPGDTNGDGRPDLLTRDTGGGTLRIYPGQANGTIGNPITFGSGWTATSRPLMASGADADRNGTADMWATTADGKLCFYASLSGGCTAEVGNGSWQTIQSMG